MTLVLVTLKDEEVYRVFRRSSVAVGEEVTTIEIGDFARRTTENGLSMLRVKHFLDPVNAKKYPNYRNRKLLVGLAVCKAETILKTDMKFYTTTEKPEHVSLRCTDCNMNPAQGKCTPKPDEAFCPLYSTTVNGELSSWLAEQFNPKYPAEVIPYAD